MRLLLTVSTSGAGPAPVTREVEVEAGTGSTAGELAAALSDHLGATGAVLSCRGQVVDDSSPVGAPPLVDGAALTLGGVPSPGRPSRPRTPVQLCVVHGPDSGRTVELAPGTHTVGRSHDADICLEDPGLSRVHAELHVSADGVQLADLGSTNGTGLDGERLGECPRPLRPGSVVTMGTSVLRLGAPVDVPAATRRRPDGTTAVNRRPRVVHASPPAAIALPTPPEAPRRSRVPWVAMLLPIPFAAVMAAFFGPMMLAFAVMSPAVMAGTALSDRFGARRRYAEEVAEHRRRLSEAMARGRLAADAEAAELLRAHPDPASVLATACGPSARLWERRRHDPDALLVSIGTCDRAAGTRLVPGPGHEAPDQLVLRGVPCVLSWPDVGTAGICGDRATMVAAARWWLGQVATSHSPRDVHLVLLTSAHHIDDWPWLLRLPHARRDGGPLRDDVLAVGPTEARRVVSALGERLSDQRQVRAGSGDRWAGPWTVLVVDGGDGLRDVAGLADVLAEGRSVGVLGLVLAPERGALPPGCGAVLDLGRPAQPRLDLPGAAHEHLAVDRVGHWWADRLSRGLAPLRDATPAPARAALPDHLTLGTVSGTDLADPRSVAARWASAPACTAVPVGAGANGSMVVDLATDGPHLLVGGTTGSGKSEFLRTLVASLAVHHRPDLLSLVLVDYKGGAAFRECADLPHVSGVVTDLDEHLADRALVSLRAELTRRERVLQEAGVPDFTAYHRDPAARLRPLPRLVLVVDEFRALADELPAFVDGMVRFAALGRSLGVHVVLATQRPAGVVTADIKANVNLRIALRMRDAAESDDVVGVPDAARIPPGLPGRALCSAGGTVPVEFQAAHVGGVLPAAEATGIVVRDLVHGRPHPDRAPTPPAAGPTASRCPPGVRAPTDAAGAPLTELQALVRAVREASAGVDVPAPPAVWLPPLPDRLDLPLPSAALAGTTLAVGLADVPARQAQEPFVVDLAAPGHWAFVGAGGSGRTSALVALARVATAQLPSVALHLYAVSGGSLAALAALPHCGTHATWDEVPRVQRLVERLGDELRQRRAALAATTHASVAAWRAADPGGAPPHLVLLLDDWDLLQARTDDLVSGALTDRLLALLREGDGLGLTAALAGGRGLLVGRAAAAVSHRVLLRLSDPADALVVGLPARSLPPHQPPGRGVLADGTEVQLARPPEWEPAQDDDRCTRPGSTRRPIRVDPLPASVEAEELAGVDPAVFALGRGGDEGELLGLEPSRDGRRWLVCGAPRSGVTSTLQVVVRHAVTTGCRVAVVGAELAEHAPSGVTVVDPMDPQPLVELRRAVPDLVVVVDDAHAVADTPVDAVLREISTLVDRDGGLLVCGAAAGPLTGQYRGAAVEVARHRTGVLLGRCAPLEADLLGVRPTSGGQWRPGRGLLVTRGTAVPIQVAGPRPG